MSTVPDSVWIDRESLRWLLAAGRVSLRFTTTEDQDAEHVVAMRAAVAAAAQLLDEAPQS